MIFTPDQVQHAIDETLVGVDTGTKGALVVVATTEGVKAAVVHRIDNHWQIGLFGEWHASDGFKAGAKVQAQW